MYGNGVGSPHPPSPSGSQRRLRRAAYRWLRKTRDFTACLQQASGPLDRRARYLGALLGLAVGDALGAAVQDKKPGTFDPAAPFEAAGAFGQPAGASWTDDTAMTLCLAESLLYKQGGDARDQLERYARWQREGYLSDTGRALGITPAVARAIATAQWSGKPFAGSHDPKRLDKEALPRMAAIALYFAVIPSRPWIRPWMPPVSLSGPWGAGGLPFSGMFVAGGSAGCS